MILSLNRRGRPLGRWLDKVKEFMTERGTGRGIGGDWVALNKQ